MPDRSRRPGSTWRRGWALLTTTALLGTLLAVVPTLATVASAADGVVFDNTFTDSTVDGTGTVTTPTSPGGTNEACLTASGNTSTDPLLSCSGTSDAEGDGALRLTSTGTDQLGAVFGSESFSSTHGLEVSFDSYQYGGNGADGIGFVLAADDPDAPAPPTTTGPGGGSLGYATSGGQPGVPDGYLGIGLDVYGNFSSGSVSGRDCTTPANISSLTPGAVVVRGPGSGTTGYCGLSTTYDGTSDSQLTLRGGDRAAARVPVRVLVNPTGAPLTASDGEPVPAHSYRVVVTPVGGTQRTLTGDLPVVPPGLYPSDSWLDADGVPKQLSFGWFGSTGGLSDVHEITDAQVRSLDRSGPDAPTRPTATAGLRQATLSWTAPDDNGATISSYVITPYLSDVAQAPVTVDAAATTRVLTGLAAGGSYRFTVAAVTSEGASYASPRSQPAVPYAELDAPTITSVQPGDTSARLTWDPPSSTGGSPITGYVVTPYVGSVAQTPQTFPGTATTHTVTGLDPGTAYTFRVAAQNDSGTTPLYRIDTGGPLVPTTDDGPDWAADDDSSPYRRGGNSASSDPGAPSVLFDGTVPSGTPAALFDHERYGTTSWRFPVDAGTPVVVRLYFANRYSGTSTAGSRVFDVALDGSAVLHRFDIVVGAGADQTATLREFETTSDGAVDLDFTAQVENPLVNAIEIVRTGVTTTGPSSAASDAVTPNDTVTLSFPPPPAGQVGVAYRDQLTATGGTPPFAWTVSDGTLPDGLDLDPTTGLLSGTPTTAGTFTFTVQVTDDSPQSARQSVTLVVARAAPEAPTRPTATAGLRQATLSWTAPDDNGATISSYVITPYLSDVAQAPVTVDAATTTRVVNSLTAGGSYTFTVAAVSSQGTSDASPASNRVTPYAELGAPTITSVQPGDTSARLTWDPPSSTGGSPITGYVVTPYVGSVAQTPQTFPGTATTHTITGLTPGTAYTFRVAAQNDSGTTPLYRINAGGPRVPATDGGPDWAADPDDDPYRTGGYVGSFSPSATLDGTVPSGTPVSLFDDERYGHLVWRFPVPSGTPVEVRLYDAERAFAGNEGGRWFDVDLDDVRVLDHFSPYVAAGGSNIATMREFATTSDGSVDLHLVPLVENPNIEAIEVVQTGVPATGPSSAASDTVTPNDAVTTSFPPPPPGEVGVAYRDQLVATGGTAPFTWTVSAGTLPDGLDLDPTTGLLSGTPTTAGTSSATLTVTDAGGGSASRAVSIVVAARPALTFDAPADGQVAVSYSTTFTATGGTAPLVWSITDGSLPPGLTLSASTGVLSGTPTTVGSSSFTVAVTDADDVTASRAVTLAIAAGPLVIAKTADTSSTAAGARVSFTITLTNTGAAPFTGVALVDALGTPGSVLDDAAYDGNAAATAGTVGDADGTLTWSGDVPASGSVVITYSVTVNNPDTGDHRLTSTVTSSTSGTNCSDESTDPRCTTSVAVAGLSITTAVDPTSTAPGGVVHYLVTASNTGQTTYHSATIMLDFGEALDDATFDDDVVISSGHLRSGPDGKATWVLTLAPGESATGMVSFSVSDPTTASGGDKILATTVTSDVPGSSCPSEGSDPTCRTTVPVLGLSISLVAAPAEVVAGGALSYTITATNTGGGDDAAATLSDDLRALLPYGVYAQDATATSGQVSESGGTLTWSGPLARGEQVRISFSVRVATDVPDTTVLSNRVVSTSTGSTCPDDRVDPGCSTTTSVAARTLTLTDLTPSFTLSGLPGSTVEQDGAVGLTVSTNSPGGYSVTVAASSDALTGSSPGNADTISIARLSVRESGARLFTPLSTDPVLVHTSTGPSSPDGDAISNDYRVDVPDVASDTYSTTLEYVATAQ